MRRRTSHAASLEARANADYDSDDEFGEEVEKNAMRAATKSDQQEVDEPEEHSTAARLRSWLREKKLLLEGVMGKVKIVVSTYQVVSSTASVVGVQMPAAFSQFMESMNCVNLSISTVLPLSCGQTYTFIDSLYFATLLPMLVAACLMCAFVYEYSGVRKTIQADRNRQRGDKAHAFNEIKTKYLSYFFYLTYLVLPSVTTTIFQMFLCTDMDPNGETPGEDNLFLTADMRISCSSDYFYGGETYASIMVIVYPVGIPLLYLWMLYNARDEIKGRAPVPGPEEVAAENGADTEGATATTSNPMQVIAAWPSSSVTSGSLMAESAGSALDKKESVSASAPVGYEDILEENSLLNSKINGLLQEISLLKTQTQVRPNVALASGDVGSSVVEVNSGRPSSNTWKSSRSVLSLVGEDPVGKHSSVSPNTARLSFLWAAYSPEFWYWEVIETTRRLVLTAVLSVVEPGSAQQSVLSILLAQFFLKLYGFHMPYGKDSDNALAEVGQYQIFFTFFAALIIQNGLLDPFWDQVLGVLLVLINLGLVFYCFHLCYTNQLVEWWDSHWAPTAATAAREDKDIGNDGEVNGGDGIQMSSFSGRAKTAMSTVKEEIV